MSNDPSKSEQIERASTKINIRDDEMGDISVISDIADLELEDYMKMDKRALVQMIMASGRIAKGEDFNAQTEESNMTVIMNRLDEMRDTIDRMKKNEDEWRRDPQAFFDKVKDENPHDMTPEKRAELQAAGGQKFREIQAGVTARKVTAQQRLKEEQTVEVFWPAIHIPVTNSQGIVQHQQRGIMVNLVGLSFCYPPNEKVSVPKSVYLRLQEMLKEMEGNQKVADVLDAEKIKPTETVNREFAKLEEEYGSPLPRLSEI